ncbi:complex I subunit 5 family protein [Aquisalimonas asiatica]|uniref:Multisubunit sodium/proton antiporter, MrpD subunit n=1 Tax=Aquisalimonas asiatica TaxID=406100 RepID=A0A1H8PTY0_9GAMM|nr:proton-conducting transporter membrane subunit [Aquisalimonas asiatica]SEO45134.1 multisubunit sodium/proton antiporter, MrpD subunit [Aquisalimonas asiatica]
MTEFLPVIAVFVPFLAGIVQFLFGPRALPWWPLLAVAATVASSLWLVAAVAQGGEVSQPLGGWDAPLGIEVRVDGLAAVMLLLTTVVGALVSVHAFATFHRGHPSASHYWALWLLLWGSLNVLFVSGDLFNLYVALELVSLAAIPMVLLAGPAKTVSAALAYLHFALFGSLVYLAGVAITYGLAGSLDLRLVADALADGGFAGSLAAALLITGVLVKAAIVPFHIWLPAAHGNAPAVVSAALSALVVKACVYLLLRLWTEPLAGVAAPQIGQMLGAVGAAAILYGSIQACRQERLKLVVAYSTVAQLGYMLLFFPMASALAWEGAVYHGLAHGVAKAALFLAAGNVLAYVGHDRLRELRGLDRPLSVSLFAFALASVSIMGLPPSGGFIAKWLLLSAALESGQWWWVAVLLVGGLLAAVYVFRVLRFAFLQAPGPVIERPGPAPGPLMAWPAMILALLAVALGLTSAPLLELLGGLPGGTP